MAEYKYEMDYLCTYSATLAPPEVIGPVAEGIRINFYVTGGEANGPKLRGKLRPVGGDWLTLRRDGIAVLDVRATFETAEGALIYVIYNGIGDLGPDGYENFLAGKMPDRIDLRTAPRMWTVHPDYLWVNRVQCVGVGAVTFASSSVSYDLYALR
jgi:hypothetical protein